MTMNTQFYIKMLWNSQRVVKVHVHCFIGQSSLQCYSCWCRPALLQTRSGTFLCVIYLEFSLFLWVSVNARVLWW